MLIQRPDVLIQRSFESGPGLSVVLSPEQNYEIKSVRACCSCQPQ
jgi:hypothetical protein